MESKLHKPRKWLAVAGFCLFAAIPVLADTETVGDYTWTYHIENGGAVIYCGPGQLAVSPDPSGHVDIPATLGGCPATGIGDYAFVWCGDLTSVTIPDSVTSIGNYAFNYCRALTRVTIPDSVTSIGESTFDDCEALTSVIIPDSVTSIGNYAFNYCRALTSVTIPDSVMSIGYSAFSGCDNLMSISVADNNISYKSVNGLLMTKDGTILIQGVNGDVTIPDSVTSVGDYAFAYFSGLTSVTIPDSVMSIGYRAFSGCDNLMSISVADNNINYKSVNGLLMTKDGTTLIQGVNGDVTIPDSVTSIGEGAFSCCYGLTSVTIPDSVTSIGRGAFSTCVGLTSVTIPDSVTSIGRGAFEVCDRLTSVNIPDSVTSIGYGAFAYCSGLASATLPETLREQVERSNVFEDSSTTLNYYEVPAWTVTFDTNGGDALAQPMISVIKNRAIGALGALPTPSRAGYVFSGWWTSPDGGERVTGDTIATADMTLYAHWQKAPYDNWRGYAPWIVEEDGSWRSGDIGDGEYSAIDVYFVGPAEVSFKWKTSSESGYDSLRYTVCVPDGSLFGGDYYTETLTGAINGEMSDWESKTLQVPESGNCRLSFSYEKDGSASNGEDCGWVKELVFSELQAPSAGFTFVENSSGGVTLTGVSNASGDIVIPSEYNGLPVTDIGDYAFYDCDYITSVTIPDSVTSVGYCAFSDCDNLMSISVADNNISYKSVNGLLMTKDGTTIIQGVNGDVTIPDSVTSIGRGAFSCCFGLTSVTIPDSVTSIGQGAFEDCGRLTSVNIPDSVTSIGVGAFNGCNGLTSVTIPNSVTSIGQGVFANCNGLTSVTIPASVTSIGNYAFAWCSQLEEVIFEGNESDIEMNKDIVFASTPWLTRPANDEYENAQIVEGSEGSVAGTLAGTTIADNDCICGYVDAERTIWYKWTATFTGFARFSATADNGENDLLYLVATRGYDYGTGEWDDCGYDNGCSVTFQVTEGVVYYVSIAGRNYYVTGLTLSWGEYIPPPPPANDDFADALPLAGASGSVSGTNEDATYEADEYRPVGSSSATVWWTWRAPYSGTATFDMSGSSFDTVLAVFTGDALPSLTLVGSDDDGGDSGNTSRLSFNAEAGTLYRIWCGGYSDSVGEYVLAWRLEGDGVSVAAEGVSQEYASEAEAQSASETLAVAVPREVVAVVADADEYRSYFAKTVRETSPGSGIYVVEAALDPAKVLPQDAEEKAALDGAVLEAALDAEAGETTLTGAKPGLYYSIVADTDLAGSFSTGGEPALCGADGSVTISKPDVSGLNGSAVFFRVKIDAYAR